MDTDSELKLAFIGAGNVNFGGGEGPWDHASRLEKIGGVRFVAVADPDVERATAAVEKRRAGPAGSLWTGCRVFSRWRSMLDEAAPDAVFLGVPPDAHGAPEGDRAMEVECARRGVHLFVEKPLGAGRIEEVLEVRRRLEAAAPETIVGVGYMFRYHPAVDRMREILAERPPLSFSARYCCAYEEIRKPEWWDVRRTGGLIVEQATHFVDLARWLCGEVDPGTIRARQIRGDDPAARLSRIPVGPDGRSLEESVPGRYRPPRVTTAFWRFESGALGSLLHGALLHGRRYESEIEIWGDGLRLVLEDPYGACRLRIREPGGDVSRVETFDDADPYMEEDRAFLEAVRRRRPESVRSPYADAFRTYELSCAITAAAEGH